MGARFHDSRKGCVGAGSFAEHGGQPVSLFLAPGWSRFGCVPLLLIYPELLWLFHAQPEGGCQPTATHRRRARTRNSLFSFRAEIVARPHPVMPTTSTPFSLQQKCSVQR